MKWWCTRRRRRTDLHGRPQRWWLGESDWSAVHRRDQACAVRAVLPVQPLLQPEHGLRDREARALQWRRGTEILIDTPVLTVVRDVRECEELSWSTLRPGKKEGGPRSISASAVCAREPRAEPNWLFTPNTITERAVSQAKPATW
jgi:hypothetical protein